MFKHQECNTMTKQIASGEKKEYEKAKQFSLLS